MSSLTPRLDSIDQNLIINGGFIFWQRGGVSGSINTTTSYAYQAADRWLHRHTGTFTGTPNVIRDASSPANNLSIYSMKHTFRRNAAAAQLDLQQRIESVFAQKAVASGKCSLSFYINSTLATGSVRVRLAYATASDNHASQTEFYNSGLIAVGTASVWQLIELENISVPANALNGIALFIEYSLPSGTDGSDQNVRVSQVMLNKNAKVSDFTPAGSDAVSELQLCQRYFEKSYSLDTNPATATTVGCIVARNTATGSVSNHTTYVSWKVQKRSIPTLLRYDTAGNSNRVSTAVNSTITPASTNITVSDNGDSFTNQQGTGPYILGTSANVSFFHYTADAEIN